MKERFCQWLACKLPKRVAFWCFMRVCANATTGKYGTDTPTGMTWETIYDRWE